MDTAAILASLLEIWGIGAKSISPVAGGDINHAYRIQNSQEEYFLKFNTTPVGKEILKAELNSICLLCSHTTLALHPLGNHLRDDFSGLLFKYFEPKPWNETAFEILGNGLAEIHRVSSQHYGASFPGYIGKERQSNKQHDSFISFFIEERIEPLLRKAVKKSYLETKEVNTRLFYKNISSIIPEEQPRLIHGDLWAGNILNTLIGPLLIDPSAHFSHREMDIAMTFLFGGFSHLFIKTYEESFPLCQGWQERIPLFQLYPLLAHLVMFGTAYRNQVLQIFKKYT